MDFYYVPAGMPTERGSSKSASGVAERVATRHASGGSRRPAGAARNPAEPVPTAATRYPVEPTPMGAATRYPPEPSKQKRGREPKQTPDEHSSGQVFVPPKVSTAQYRGGGGRVTIVDNQNQVQAGVIKTDPIKIGDPNTLWNIPNTATIASNVAPITR